MIKLLHSADWHLDSPIQGRTPQQTQLLHQALLRLPQQIAATAMAQGCDLMLLSGDLFDGPASAESIAALRTALEEVRIPVFIAPGNHDPLNSVWSSHIWPDNVHIFTGSTIESIVPEGLNCRIYGAAFAGAESPSMLKEFRADCSEQYAIGILHGDPTQANSPYCPITADQVASSNLDYLALGHIHKGDSFHAGKTLCAWPGCPMGRGYDELGEKGVLIVTLDSQVQARFLSLDTPRFYDLECDVQADAAAALERMLPAVGNSDFYRITLIGESAPLDLDALAKQLDRFPNLTLRDRTVPPLDIWGSAGEDSLEGIYFDMLRQQLGDHPDTAALAARISRQILEGLEVTLP